MDTDFHIAPVSVGYVALAVLSLSRRLAQRNSCGFPAIPGRK